MNVLIANHLAKFYSVVVVVDTAPYIPSFELLFGTFFLSVLYDIALPG